MTIFWRKKTTQIAIHVLILMFSITFNGYFCHFRNFGDFRNGGRKRKRGGRPRERGGDLGK